MSYLLFVCVDRPNGNMVEFVGEFETKELARNAFEYGDAASIFNSDLKLIEHFSPYTEEAWISK